MWDPTVKTASFRDGLARVALLQRCSEGQLPDTNVPWPDLETAFLSAEKVHQERVLTAYLQMNEGIICDSVGRILSDARCGVSISERAV